MATRVAASVKPVLRHALDLMRKGIDEGCATLLGLRPPVLLDGSLEKALFDVRNDFALPEGVRLRMVILGKTKPLEHGVHQQMLWIAREALLNALRHSEASSVETEIEYLQRKLRVTVRDNGIGIDPQALRSSRNQHWGLIGMQERAASIGAEIRVWSSPGAGTEVGISVPIRGEACAARSF